MHNINMQIIQLVANTSKHDKESVIDLKREKRIKIFDCNLTKVTHYFNYAYFLKLVTNHGYGY